MTETELRKEITQKAYEWVKQHRLLCQHYHQRYQWYRQMRAKLPELNQQLSDRLKKLKDL